MVAQMVEQERANSVSIPVANLGVVYAQSQGAKTAKQEWFNPWGQIIRDKEIEKKYSDRFLATLSELIQEKVIPNWVYSQLNPDVMAYINRRKS